MMLDVLTIEARHLVLGEEDIKYAADPVAYNSALAKLLIQLKKDKDTGVTGLRQGYKGTGSQSHKRQIWAKMPSHERGGPDIWLEGGFVKIGGVVSIPNTIPHARKYGEDPPQVVYNWIADTLKQVMAFQKAKYNPQDPKPESVMNTEINKKLGALRSKLEADLGEEGSTPQYTNVIKASGAAKATAQAKMTGGSTPKQPPPAKNAIVSVRSIAVVGAQSTPPSKKVKDSILPSKAESFPGFRRLAGLVDDRTLEGVGAATKISAAQSKPKTAPNLTKKVEDMDDGEVVGVAQHLAQSAEEARKSGKGLAFKEGRAFKQVMQRIKDEGMLGDKQQTALMNQWQGKGGY